MAQAGEMTADLSGSRFGLLLVQRWVGKTKNRQALWECICDCGNGATVRIDRLRDGVTRSCGCLARSIPTPITTTHGMTYSLEFRSWQSMKDRCSNPNGKSWKYYGGRGIRVCERWINSFEDFYADMGPRPSLEYSIDRIDVNGNYEPGNCRWATKAQQIANRRPR